MHVPVSGCECVCVVLLFNTVTRARLAVSGSIMASVEEEDEGNEVEVSTYLAFESVIMGNGELRGCFVHLTLVREM